MRNSKYLLFLIMISMSSLLAVPSVYIGPEYSPGPLKDIQFFGLLGITNLKGFKVGSKNGVLVGAQYIPAKEFLDFSNSVKARQGFKLFYDKYDAILCTVKNDSNDDFVIDANQIKGIPLVSADEVAATLNPLKWKKALGIVGASWLGSEVLGRATQADFGAKEPSMYTGFAVAFTPGWHQALIAAFGLPDILLPTATAALLYGGSLGKLVLGLSFSPAAIWSFSAVIMYTLYQEAQMIKKDMASKILSPHQKIVVKPRTTKSFLLITPTQNNPILAFSIEGMDIAMPKPNF